MIKSFMLNNLSRKKLRKMGDLGNPFFWLKFHQAIAATILAPGRKSLGR
jgi:hypothetical protein